MYTMLKTCAGTTLVPAETRLMSERKLFLQGEITTDSALELIRALMVLVNEDAEAPIDLYVSSPGGEVNAGMMIVDALAAMTTEVDITCVGMAASMAAIILASGKKGHRYILPHSQVMLHEPLIPGGVGGSASSIQRTAESILETKRQIVRLLCTYTGRTKKEIEAAVSYDNYLNAEEAVAFGICDSVTDSII